MDQQLLQSFNNLSVALQNLANSLEANANRDESTQSSMIADALSKSDIAEQVKFIQEGVKQLVDTNVKIIEQQKNILDAVKGGESKTEVETAKLADLVEAVQKKSEPIEAPKTGELTLLDKLNEKIKVINDKFESMVEAIQKQSTKKEEPKKTTDISFQKRINEVVEKIFNRQNEDSKKIEKTADMVKSQKEAKGPNFLPDKKQKETITDGVKIILLIAAGVLAIGLAFKLIGDVKWESVLALSLSLPLIALAFKQIAELKIEGDSLMDNLAGLIVFSLVAVGISYILSAVKPITPEQALTVLLIGSTFALLSFSLGKLTKSIVNVNLVGLIMLPIVLIATSFAITVSSGILQGVQPLSIGQAFTTLLIGGTFALLSYSLGKLTKNISGVDIEGLILMPLVLISASFAIMVSSYILNGVKPIGLPQLLTTIAIAATFTVISYGIAKIAKAASGIDPDGLVMLPLVLIAAAFAIMASSPLLAAVTPIRFDQFLTSVGIAIVFIPISFSLVLISKAFEKMDVAKMAASSAILPLLFVAMSMAIVLSSIILSKIVNIPFETLKNIALQSIAISVAAIAVGAGIFVLSKLGFTSTTGLKTLGFGALGILIIAGTISAASQLLMLGDYSKPPSLGWTIKAGLSILAFGILIAVTGTLLTLTGLAGAGALIAGGLAVLGIAAVILGVDKILSLGDYKKGPSLEYSMSTVLLLGGFGLIMVLTGPLIIPLGLGAASLLLIAGTIWAIDKIISKVKFDKIPPEDYVKNVLLLITEFGTFMVGAALLLPALTLGAASILIVAGAIVGVDKMISLGNYDKVPSSEYVNNLFTLISTYSDYMKESALSSPLLLLGAVSISIVAGSILAVDKIISSGDYSKSPTQDYVKNITSMLNSFSSLMLEVGGPIKLASLAFGNRSINKIAESIRDSSMILGEGKYDLSISSVFTNSMISLLNGFSTLMLEVGGPIKLASLAFGNRSINIISESIRDSSMILGEGKYDLNITDGFAKSLISLLNSFSTLMLEVGGPIKRASLSFGKESLKTITETILEISETLSTGKFDLNISTSWVSSVVSMFREFSSMMLDFGEVKSAFSLNIGESSLKIVAESIRDTSMIISQGKYDIMIPDGYMSSLVSNFNTYELLNKVSDEFDLDAIQMSERAAASIAILSNLVSTGKYDTIIPVEWGTNLTKAFLDYQRITSLVSVIDPELINLTQISSIGIANMSNFIAKGNYSTVVPASYGQNLLNLFTGYKGITEVVESMNPGIFSGLFGFIGDTIDDLRGKNSEKMTPESVALNIVSLSNIISKGKYEPIPDNWMQSVYLNMKQYLRLMDLMSGSSMSTEVFDFSSNVGTGISRIASDFEKLANSIDRVSTAIAEIDIEKVSAIKALTGSVVLLSLMDSDQFEMMLDKIEEKSSIISEVFNDLNKSGQTSLSSSVKTATPQVPDTSADIKRIASMMGQIDSKLATIASASSNVSSYVNQIRSSPKGATMKK